MHISIMHINALITICYLFYKNIGWDSWLHNHNTYNNEIQSNFVTDLKLETKFYYKWSNVYTKIINYNNQSLYSILHSCDSFSLPYYIHYVFKYRINISIPKNTHIIISDIFC